MHQTTNLNDGYMGSGKLIKNAIIKHGLDKFKKEILFIFDNEKEMKNKEKELVILSEDTYNLCDGGKGGFGYINKIKTKSQRSEHGKLAHVKHPHLKQNLLKAHNKLSVDKSTQSKIEKYGSDYFKKIASKPKSNSHKANISRAMLEQGAQEKVKCPICSKVGGARLMKRWHFQNCKYIGVV